MQDRDRAVKEIAGMLSATSLTPSVPSPRLRLFEVTHSTGACSTVLGTFEAERVLCRDGTLVVERQCESGPVSALGRREMTALAIYAPGAWTSVKEIEPAVELEMSSTMEEAFGEFPGSHEDNAPGLPIISTADLAGIDEEPGPEEDEQGALEPTEFPDSPQDPEEEDKEP